MDADLQEAIISALKTAKRMAEYQGEAVLAYMIDMPIAEAAKRPPVRAKNPKSNETVCGSAVA